MACNVPFEWQTRYLRETRPLALLKARQIGASTSAAAMAIHTVLYHAGTTAATLSPSLKQSQEIAGKARTALRNLGVRLVIDSAAVIGLPNGSRILSLPGTPKSVRGFTCRLLIIDEAAYVQAETWTAAAALVATGGRTIYQSTPAAADGPFYAVANGEDPDLVRMIVRADEVPTISQAFLESQQRALSPVDYASEFLSFERTLGLRRGRSIHKCGLGASVARTATRLAAPLSPRATSFGLGGTTLPCTPRRPASWSWSGKS